MRKDRANEFATQKYDTPTPVSAALDVPAGRIHVIAADRVDTIAEIRPADSSRSLDVKAAGRIKVTYADGVLRIEAPKTTTPILGARGSVEVTVHLPAGSRLEAKAATTELRGVGRLGDVTVAAAQGSINLDETASAHLTLQSGTISVGRLGGPAQIATRKGDLHITEAVTGTVTLRTEQGDISIGAARGACASLDAGTAYGRVHNALNNNAGATSGLTIHATTTHGDITARSL